MGILSEARDISELGQRNLWVLWGKSGTGKTHFIGTMPKPLLYIQVGDDGSNTIADVDGVKAIRAGTLDRLKQIGNELINDTKYVAVAVDTFSMITNVWIDANATQKKKKMTQSMWGDLKCETEELIKIFHSVAESHVVALSCHEVNDTIEGMDDEVIPDFGPSTTKGARIYLQGMANFGLHFTKVNKTIADKATGEEKEVVKYAVHIGPNPYYWTKLQINDSIKIPQMVINPSYTKISNIIGGK
jgi:hypothetical protein